MYRKPYFIPLGYIVTIVLQVGNIVHYESSEIKLIQDRFLSTKKDAHKYFSLLNIVLIPLSLLSREQIMAETQSLKLKLLQEQKF